MKIKHFLLGICFLATTQSCQKLDSPNNNENESLSEFNDLKIKSSKGTLIFTDSISFIEDISKINQMNSAQFSQFEKSIGFTSLATAIDNAILAFDNINSEEELVKWKKEFGDVVEFKDSTVVPKIGQGIYQRIVDRSGKYYFKKSLNQILPDKIITIIDGSSNKISSAVNLDKSNLSNGIIITDLPAPKRLTPSSLKAASKMDKEAARCNGNLLANRKDKDGNRRVFLDFYLVPFIAGYQIVNTVQVEAHGHKKTLFGWNKYKSRYRIDNLTYSVMNGNGEVKSVNNVSVTNKNDEYYVTYFQSLFDDYTVSNPKTANFINAKGRSTSRGVLPLWAVVCCNPENGCPTDYENYPL